MEDDMDDMVANAALWVIFAAAIALIAVGCSATRRAPKPATQNSEQRIDRAA